MNAVSSLHRLTSMNDVLTLQEEKLEPTSSTNQEKRQSILNCWRTKVYDLLMQLKSMELVLKNGSSKFSNGKTTSKPLISADVCAFARGFCVQQSTFFLSLTLCSETFDRQRAKHCELHLSLFFVQILNICKAKSPDSFRKTNFFKLNTTNAKFIFSTSTAECLSSSIVSLSSGIWNRN